MIPIDSVVCALIVCRDSALPAGADECFQLSGGQALVLGTGASAAAQSLKGLGHVTAVETSGNPAGLAGVAARYLSGVRLIVVPASPDGRDLAPLIALTLNRPLITGVTRFKRIAPERSSPANADAPAESIWEITAVRSDGLLDHIARVDVPAVITMVPGLHGVGSSEAPTIIEAIDAGVVSSGTTVHMVSVLPADPSTMDLTEASCIVAGGQGLARKERFDRLGRIGGVIGGSLGGTRVASDAGWIPFERQIGTTGVAVNPRVYLAFGISGATQHTSGLGTPDHIVSVNTDASCPMMTMSDVAIVSDAQAVLEALEEKLRARSNHSAESNQRETAPSA